MKAYNPSIVKLYLKYFSKIGAKKTIFHFFILFLRDENLPVSYVEHLNRLGFFRCVPLVVEMDLNQHRKYIHK
ncbi:MAG: hypothetical protein BWZ06_00291 [Bacteroidetes bacterium ADurb.BinA261]|nr:MAG: hypothetical protein BWZ06_00291 [Bacteroidetes bacterium ADurb.BinA261]